MIILKDPETVCLRGGSVVVLGMFDGVHLGHRKLLQRGRELADRLGKPLVVDTFSTHPLEVIAPGRAPSLLTGERERIRIMAQIPVDVLYCPPFSREVMETAPEEYMRQLIKRFHPAAVVCGFNHTFGRKAAGTPAVLRRLGRRFHFHTVIVPEVILAEETVSSTLIRQCLSQGEAYAAMRLLGRPYQLQAEMTGNRVVFPEEKKQKLPSGRYRVLVSNDAGGSESLPGVLTIAADGTGFCPAADHGLRRVDFLAEL